jgi:hypothetical protein
MGISLCRGGSSANRYILIRHSARSDLSTLLDRKEEESGLIATKPQPISQRVGGTATGAAIFSRSTPRGKPSALPWPSPGARRDSRKSD